MGLISIIVIAFYKKSTFLMLDVDIYDHNLTAYSSDEN
jgi:hypothetical protein